jgi:hypothetical protein
MEELRNYVGLHFKHHPADIKKMMKLMQDVDIVQPTDPPAVSSETTKQIWQQEVKMYCEQVKTCKQNKCALYSVIWGQCSEAMQAKIKSDKLYDDMQEVDDSLTLIKMIKGIAYKFESQKNIYLALDNAKCAFYAYKQGKDETNANYMSKFKNTIEVIEHYGGTIGEDNALILEELKTAGCNYETATAEKIETAQDLAKRKMHAIAFLKRADKG